MTVHAGQRDQAVVFEPVNSAERSLDRRVVSYIGKLIESGELQPGDRLPPERQLAIQLGVSRTVLREALHTLAALGLVKLQHGRGVFVTAGRVYATAQRLSSSRDADSSDARLHDLFEVRRTLEGSAAEWAAARATPAQIAELRSILDEVGRVYKKETLDVGLAGVLDARFHAVIAAATSNRIVMMLMAALMDELSIARERSLAIPGRAQKSLLQHEHVLSAIVARDPAAARLAMLEHLIDVEQSVQVADVAPDAEPDTESE